MMIEMENKRLACSIVLDKIRLTLNSLRKANIFNETGNSENPLLANFRELQNVIRYSTQNELDAGQIIGPFASLLQVNNMTSPFVLVALESIRAFVLFDVLTNSSEGCTKALTDLVHALIFCRFVQTDSAGDDLVQLRIMDTLHCLATCKTSMHLSGDTIWRMINFCIESLLRNGGNKRSLLHYHKAETTIADITLLLLNKAAAVCEGEEVDMSPLIKLCEYYIKVLNAYAARRTADNGKDGTGASNRSGNNINNSSSADSFANVETQHVSFALTALHALLMYGNCTSPNAIESLIVRSDRMRVLLADDLGLCVLTLIQTREEAMSSQVMQGCLNVFMALRCAVGPSLRIVVECFMKQVFIRSLLQIASAIEVAEQGMSSDSVTDGATVALAHLSGGGRAVFSVDELELVLESLCDLLADASFIPSLYASFDCDPTRPDIARPLLKSICTCSSFVLRSGAEYLGQYKEIGILVVQLYKHILNGFGVRYHAFEASSAESSAISESLSRPPARCDDISKLFRCGRIAKLVLREASVRFVEKPERGLRYLQQEGAMSTPLSAIAVANFLRLTPDLPKEAVGSYIGELGKDIAAFEGDAKDFHAKVLLQYVSSFEFAGQSILDCMRIFLSAFRLPGEAQQIDRILVAFSEYCHSNSAEGRSGLLQNAEVTYLLSFSIIMLNTDRHNPNIKEERRMTVDQFVKNNTNYGKDVHQTVPLPRPFLEAIYASISELPIRTESHDISASVTTEVWKDMQLQALVDPRRAILLGFSHSREFIDRLLQVYTNPTTLLHRGKCNSSTLSQYLPFTSTEHCPRGQVSDRDLTVQLLVRLLTEDALFFGDPLTLYGEILGSEWALDADILELLGTSLLQVGVAVHYNNYLCVKSHDALRSALPVSQQGRSPSAVVDYATDSMNEQTQIKERTGKFLLLSNEFLLESLRIFRVYKLDHYLDLSLLLLGGFSGLLETAVTDCAMRIIFNGEVDLTKTAISEACFELTRSPPSALLPRMLLFPSMRASLVLLLEVVHFNQTQITLWPLVWLFLGMLRDAGLLPPQMVLVAEDDCLPASDRLQFETTLSSLDKVVINSSSSPVTRTRAHTKASPSLLSLQGLGEVLFGGPSERADLADVVVVSPAEEEEANRQSYMRDSTRRNNLPSARWDTGYEGMGDGFGISSSSDLATVLLGDRSDLLGRSSGHSDASLMKRSLTGDELRRVFWSSGIYQLVSDTRFMSETNLRRMVSSLVRLAEGRALTEKELGCEFAITVGETGDAVHSLKSQISQLFILVSTNASNPKAASRASVAWFEIQLVEIALRNRDRFNGVWPELAQHYARTLNGTAIDHSYVTERRVIGLFRIATRMVSREKYAAEILGLLGALFISADASAAMSLIHKAPQSIDVLPAATNDLVCAFSSQIAAGMWPLLTLNVETLPLLPLEHWQILFGIIASTAAGGCFSAMKSFESMAWLLHEPRLVAKVPVFCIIGVRPLLKNNNAPATVSIGAVHLLLHLHSRLEVLIAKDGAKAEEDLVDGDVALLWESCWLPILTAMADGISDERELVRNAAAEALLSAILDRHSSAVPPGVLVNILGDVVMPVVNYLGRKILDRPFPSITADASVTVAHAGQQESASPPLQRNWMQVEMRESTVREREIPYADSEMQPSVDSNLEHHKTAIRADLELDMFGKCLSGLSMSFVQHLKRLSGFPSFDKLWLRFLDLLVYFTHSSDFVAADGVVSRCVLELEDISVGKVRDLLRALVDEHVFQHREGLRSVTIEVLHGVSRCQGLVDELGI